MRILSPSFKYSESFYKALRSGKNQHSGLDSLVSWCCVVASWQAYLAEEKTTGVGL